MDVFIALTILANFLAASFAVGSTFTLLLLVRRENLTYWLSGSLIGMATWSLGENLYTLRLFDDAATLPISLTGFILTTTLLYGFIVSFTQARTLSVRFLAAVAALLTVGAVGLAWFGQAVDGDGLTPLGYGIVAVATAYSAASLWLVLSTHDDNADVLRLPLIVFIVACAIFAGNRILGLMLPVHTLLAAAALARITWIVIQEKRLKPMERINQNLNATNAELQRAIQAVANEKSRVEALNQELSNANRYKSEFMANMSHELRTPLNSIVGYSELLRSPVYGELNEQQSDRIERIYRNGKHLAGLISAILDLNKIESGRLELDATAFDVPPLIEQLAKTTQKSCEERGLAFQWRVADDLPPLVADQVRIRQVLDNLLDNALKFTPQGSISLAADYVVVQDGKADALQMPTIGWLRDGGWLVVQVQDTGVGIAPEDQHRIFDQFAQGDSSRTREFEGIGLGLTIAKRLIEMHDGVLWMKSMPQAGSTFFVAMPSAAQKDKEYRN